MHGAVCLDHDDHVLRPAILWNDGRAMAECAELEAAFPRSRDDRRQHRHARLHRPEARSGSRKHEPDIFARIDTVLLPKDYIRFRLTGHHVSEMSDASGTLWLDVAARDWSDDLLEATGLTRAHMPRLVEGSAPSGDLLPDLAAPLGRPRHRSSSPAAPATTPPPPAASASSPPARPSSRSAPRACSSSRTPASRRTPQGAVHAFCHAIPDTWHQMGVILSASDSLEWLVPHRRPQARRPRRRGRASTAPSAVTFLPYLSGERTPHNDAAARGAFVGLAQSTGLPDLTQAVMEGVAYAFADCQRVLADAGTDFAAALAVGGGARSETWLRIIASVLDRPLQLAADSDVGAALGAARLAICAAEGAAPAEVCAAPEIVRTIEPDPALVPRYREGYARYRSLYPALKETR